MLWAIECTRSNRTGKRYPKQNGAVVLIPAYREREYTCERKEKVFISREIYNQNYVLRQCKQNFAHSHTRHLNWQNISFRVSTRRFLCTYSVLFHGIRNKRKRPLGPTTYLVIMLIMCFDFWLWTQTLQGAYVNWVFGNYFHFYTEFKIFKIMQRVGQKLISVNSSGQFCW